MSIAKIQRNVYAIGGRLIDDNDANAYLVYDNEKKYYTLIDTTTGANIRYVIESLLEILKGKDKLKYVILTSCKFENSGGLYYIYNLFKPITIAHFPDSIMIRKGECGNRTYIPSPISLEIKQKQYILDNFLILLSKNITNGNIIVKYNDILFSGSNTKITQYTKHIKYICDVNKCRSVSD
ncbi:MAG: MBL fold metallo-hydrolase [Saccharolobus sp.]|uniref:MBL fold metallo-hydrolase n=1 Tax=Saccharolobus TaxID=2100760 RepID=UPI001F0FB5C2|nr:MBL fold metallo-hydrolase [Saccharolobus shibatae]MCH4814423.1 MBL fold metallo-hydrolase [Saccharolobus shibatae]